MSCVVGVGDRRRFGCIMSEAWRVLKIDHRDPVAPLEQIVRLIDLSGTAMGAGYGRSDAVEALHDHEPAAAAVSSSGMLLGAAVARVCGPDAHLLAFALHPDWRKRGI